MFLNDLNQFYHQTNFLPESILFYNYGSMGINDYEYLAKYIKRIFIVQTNGFNAKKLYIRLRYYNNIHFLLPSTISNFVFDVITTDYLDQRLQFFIQNNRQNYKYFHIINQYPNYRHLLQQSFGFYQNLDYKQPEIIEQQQQQNNSSSQIIDTRIQFKSVTTDLIQNKFQKKIQKINFSSGIIDVFCIIQNATDYKLLLKIIKYFQNYPLTKFLIFLNGQSAIKAFDQKIFKKNCILLKSIEKIDNNDCYYSMYILSNGEYKLNYKQIDLSKELIDLL